MKPAKHILDPTFKYTPAEDTDIRETFGKTAELTVRDRFAMAVAGSIWECMDSELDSETCARGVAEKAYMVADAMLIERAK